MTLKFMTLDFAKILRIRISTYHLLRSIIIVKGIIFD